MRREFNYRQNCMISLQGLNMSNSGKKLSKSSSRERTVVAETESSRTEYSGYVSATTKIIIY